ncbi:hypothetical protein D3C87_1945780 [compost metagenome]
MPRGGKREGAGRPRGWLAGPADAAVKLPAALMEEVMAFARKLDAERFGPRCEEGGNEDGREE